MKNSQYTGKFTGICSEEARLLRKKAVVWSRAGGTAETSYEMTHEVLAICSQRKTDNIKIGAQMKEE